MRDQLNMGGNRPRASPLMIALAMGCLYFFWGSTYYAIKVAVRGDGYPPFFMAGIRNLIAGLLIYCFVRTRGAPRPAVESWKTATIVGGLLLLGGNGLVTFASRYAPSGVIAVIIAMLPLWMVILDRTRDADGRRIRTSPIVLIGVLVGFAGVVYLITPKILAAIAPEGEHAHVTTMEAVAMGACLLSSFAWANGSIYSRRKRNSSVGSASPFRDTGMQLICGGLLLLIVSAAAGEPSRMSAAMLSWKPTAALAYLIVFGSLLGYSAYIWLLSVIPAARVATYAYVNPIVAVAIGWAIGGEPLSKRTVLAASVIIGSVAVIVSARASAPPPTLNENPGKGEQGN